MKYLLSALLLAASVPVLADCKQPVPLSGLITVSSCDPAKSACLPAGQAIVEYADKVAGNDDPTQLNMALHANPWRFYDGDMRIQTVAELARKVKEVIEKEKKVERIALVASWTGVAPAPGRKPLAQQLAEVVGLPVGGLQGFLWLTRDGSIRTTQQAATALNGNVYRIAEGEEVMVSLATGWAISQEAEFLTQNNAEGLFHVGVGADILLLCPERALQAFEAAARLSHPIAAYNAALIRLDRKQKGDREAAQALLKQAAAAGDKPAQVALQKLRSKQR
ncbi:hypothetical protein [Chitinimonas lacunae]|uniref:Tetratricopeptide repeat protein n=1 Tax=Chitinimonas lacunae TaxID=1963018 RepID=A0ABV8MLW0_9NEIS